MSGTLLNLLVGFALLFSFYKGFRNAASSTATVVSTGVMRPHQAVAWTAAFNFAAIFVFPLTVAATVATGIVDPALVDPHVVFGALAGTLAWSVLAWRFSIPSSATHALVGGLAGASIAHAGTAALIAPGLLAVVLLVVLAPFAALLLGSLLVLLVSRLAFRAAPRRIDRSFRRLQRLSSAFYALGQGANDAQKSVGVIWLLLILAGTASVGAVPGWAVWWSFIAFASGTLFGGWRTVRTMGQKITRLRPVGAVCADTGAALVLLAATVAGIPVSTHQTLTGAIAGVGSAHKTSAVRWSRAANVTWAWLLTMPVSVATAALAWGIGRLLL
jgi:inorganic phosphate transporter, PiT family